MKRIPAKVVSVHVGSSGDLAKQRQPEIQFALDGIVGDRHQSFERKTWPGDKQPAGTLRRNERQWSAVSIEELAAIQVAMELAQPLSAADLGANLCLAGIASFSSLPRGSVLKFPSGAELIVEEYNPPCLDMAKSLVTKYATLSGRPLSAAAFSQAAKLHRGVVGVVEVAGIIREGDEVLVEAYESPRWLQKFPG